MSVVWFFIVLSLSFMFYYVPNEEVNSEAISDSAIGVFFLLWVYFILKIFVYHTKRILQIHSVFSDICSGTVVVIISLFSSIFFVPVGFQELFLSPTQLIILFLLSIMLFDSNLKVESNSIKIYESFLGSRRGDLFGTYPPEDILDIVRGFLIFISLLFVFSYVI